MSNISAWSKTAASNNAAAPNGWPEGQAPSSVNDCAREGMAAVRTFYENIEWRNWGHTPTRTGNTTFTIPTDVTAIYVTDRRIQCTDATTLYGTIVSSSYSAPDTTITVTLDSGNLSASLTAVALGPDVTNDPIHVSGVKDALDKTGDTMTGTLTMSGKPILQAEGAAVASSVTCDIWTPADGDTVHVTGATTITSFGTAPQAGSYKRVIFDGALTLTHGANLNIPGSANITTAANDTCLVYADTTTQLDIVEYTKADGKILIGALTSGTVTTTTSGTAHTYTGIPSWVKKITIPLNGISTNGTSQILIRIGDSGGIETTSYETIGAYIADSAVASVSAPTASGFLVGNVVAAATHQIHGIATLTLIDSAVNSWAFSFTGCDFNGTRMLFGSGVRLLDSALTQLSLTTLNGTDTFDNGSFNVLYE